MRDILISLEWDVVKPTVSQYFKSTCLPEEMLVGERTLDYND